MSSNRLGRKVAKNALKYKGCKTGDKRHRHLVDVFNEEHPHGQIASYTSYWCAIFWTAIQLISGLTHDDVPMGYNVPQLVEEAKKKGLWTESDKHIPREGDGIVYDWQDDGKGDNKGNPDHIGIVYKVTKKTIYVIEGNTTKRNKNGVAVDTGVSATREIAINGTYIRGFICPRYNAVYIDFLARRYAWKKGTPKKKYKVKGGKPNKYFKRAWRKRLPKKKMGSGCHQFVMLVMRVAGYRIIPKLTWKVIIKYLKERCTQVVYKGNVSQLRKGDIFIYRRIDSEGTHHHIFIIVEIDGDLMIAEANQNRYYAHINPSLKKAVKSYDKVWLFRAKEAA